jgi:hypothetical protein
MATASILQVIRMKRAPRHGTAFDESGASMLEFAIAAPLLLLAVLGFCDIIQWMSARQMLDEAVTRTARAASTMPNLDIDAEGKGSNDYEFKRLVLARQKCNRAGNDYLRSIGTIGVPGETHGSTGDALELVYTEDRQAGDPVEFHSAVMTLLPGDCATIVETQQTVCNNQHMGFPTGQTRPHGTSRRLLENHEILVVAYAKTNGFLPWIGSKIIQSTELIGRQPIPRTPFAAEEDPLLSTGQFPTPYPTPGEPLPVPPKPTPTPLNCVVSAVKCMKRSVLWGKYACPRNVLDPADGKCECTYKRSECFQ